MGRLKINLAETEFAVRRIITIIWVTCVKKFWDSNFNLEVIGKLEYQFFKTLPQISHIHKNRSFSNRPNWNFFDHILLLPYKFHVSTRGIGLLFFNFVNCELLMSLFYYVTFSHIDYFPLSHHLYISCRCQSKNETGERDPLNFTPNLGVFLYTTQTYFLRIFTGTR